MIIIGSCGNEHVNDKSEFLPGIASVSIELGAMTVAVTDAGYFSENNASKVPDGIIAVIAISREQRNDYLESVLNQQTGCAQTKKSYKPTRTKSNCS